MQTVAVDEPVAGEDCAPVTWLEAQSATTSALIRDAALDDVAKPANDEEFEAAVEDLRAFSRARPGFVRAEVARLRAE